MRCSQDWTLCRSGQFDVVDLSRCGAETRREVVGMILVCSLREHKDVHQEVVDVAGSSHTRSIRAYLHSLKTYALCLFALPKKLRSAIIAIKW